MWLTGRLVPDHKTIADFRKDNGPAIKKVCAQFVALCRKMGLLEKASVAIDGSKFKAVNSRDNNFTKGKMERRLAQIEESVARYLKPTWTPPIARQLPVRRRRKSLWPGPRGSREKLIKLEEEVKRLKAIEKVMLAAPDQQVSFTDPDSRSMATSGRGSGMVGYNVQAAVDTTNHLIVAHEVDQRRHRQVASCEHGQPSEGGIGGRKPRSLRRSRLLQRRGDPRMRRGWHHSHAAKTPDIGGEVGRPLWQAGFPLRG